MDKILRCILNEVNEGIIILDESLNILFWNKQMEEITQVQKDVALGQNLYQIIPRLKKEYFKNSIARALQDDYNPFFAAAMHRGLISNKLELNVRVSAFKSHDAKYLMIESTDVTSQFLQVQQLKETVKELSLLNKKLHEKEKEIERLAYYDRLTGVANRTLFYSFAEKFLESAKRNNTVLGLMFMDIDKFKRINDDYGHKAGDEAIVEVAKILTDNVRTNDVVARYGGDEFVILLPDIKEPSNYEIIASRISTGANGIKLGSTNLKISLSIGVSLYPNDADNIDELILKADRAMYHVKNIGGNQHICYGDSMHNGIYNEKF